MQLGARRAERPVEKIGRRLGCLRACIRAGRIARERRLGGFGKAGDRRAAARERPRRRAGPVPAGGPRRHRRPERRDRGAADGRGRALRLAREPLLQRAHHDRTHQPGLAEAHLGLRRMHVHVHIARIDAHKQSNDRVPVARQIIGVGRPHGADQQFVAHRAIVDEEILPERVGAGERRQRGEAFDHQTIAAAGDLDRVAAELGTEDVDKAREAPDRARHGGCPGDRRTLLERERERHVRPAHRKPAHHLAQSFRLRAVAL